MGLAATMMVSRPVDRVLTSRATLGRPGGDRVTELPAGDQTPHGFDATSYYRPSSLTMRTVRRFLYPPLGTCATPFLRSIAATSVRPPDRILWNQRGNDYEAKRRRLNRFIPLKDARILVAGVGMGRDLPSWLAYGPRELTAVDYFRYDRAWSFVARTFGRPETTIRFRQADLRALPFESGGFDVVGSDALFEHCRDLDAVLKEMCRVVRPGGCIYATFGPIYTAYGGDHHSGCDSLAHAYDHLLLSDSEYCQSVECAGDEARSPEEDGRTWIEHRLFSFLPYDGYIDLFLRHAKIAFLQLIMDPRAYEFRRRYPEKWRTLIGMGLQERDLAVMGMTVILKPLERLA